MCTEAAVGTGSRTTAARRTASTASRRAVSASWGSGPSWPQVSELGRTGRSSRGGASLPAAPRDEAQAGDERRLTAEWPRKISDKKTKGIKMKTRSCETGRAGCPQPGRVATQEVARMFHHPHETPTSWSAGFQPALRPRTAKAGSKPALRRQSCEKCEARTNRRAVRSARSERSSSPRPRPPATASASPSNPPFLNTEQITMNTTTPFRTTRLNSDQVLQSLGPCLGPRRQPLHCGLQPPPHAPEGRQFCRLRRSN